MNSYTILGFAIIIVLMILIIKKINNDAKADNHHLKQKSNDIIIICNNGNKYISKEDFVKILSQFKENILQAMNYIDSYNCYDMYKSTNKAKKHLQDWVSRQNNPIFSLTKEKSTIQEEDIIENERQRLHNKITSITDIIYNSKKENETPMEDEKDDNTTNESQSSVNKTQEVMNYLLNDLQMIITIVCDNNNCVLVNPMNMKAFEKLMIKIKKITNSYVNKNPGDTVRNYAQKEYNPIIGRNNASLINCYKNECGLGDDSIESSSIIMEKNKVANSCFPFMSGKYDNTNSNRFNTIIH